MTEAEVATFVAQVKPLGLACLFVLWAMARPLFEAEIAELVGKERHAVARVLSLLRLHGYAARGGSPPRWLLTDRGRQLLLPGMVVASSISHSTEDATMVENLPSPGSSSSSSSYNEETFGAEEKLLLPMVENLPSSTMTMHPERTDLIEFLVNRLGCASRRIAAEAIDGALEDGMEPNDVKFEALWWWMYCASGSAPSIPRERWGFFIARNIQRAICVYEGYKADERKAREVDPELVDLWRIVVDQHDAGSAS